MKAILSGLPVFWLCLAAPVIAQPTQVGQNVPEFDEQFLLDSGISPELLQRGKLSASEFSKKQLERYNEDTILGYQDPRFVISPPPNFGGSFTGKYPSSENELIPPLLVVPDEPELRPFLAPGTEGLIQPGSAAIQIATQFVQDTALLDAIKGGIETDGSTCATAAENISPFSRKLTANTLKKAQLQTFNVKAYIENCFKSVYDNTQSPNLIQIQEGLAIIKHKDDKHGRTLCTGFFLAGNRLATARHCFFRGGNTSHGKNSISLDKFEIVALSKKVEEPDSKFSIIPGSPSTHRCMKNGEPFLCVRSRKVGVGKIDGDFVELLLDRPVPNEGSIPIASGNVAAGQQLAIVMFNRLAWQQNRSESKQLEKFGREILRKSISLDQGPACVAFHSSSRCILQACQSFFSSSGSPVFSLDRESSEISYLGALYGGYQSGDNSCNSGALIKPTPNVVSRFR